MNIDPNTIFSYLLKKSTKKELAAIDQWLKESDANKQWLFELEALWTETKIDEFSREDYLKEHFKKTWSKIQDVEHGHQKPMRSLRFVKYVAAACVLIAMGLIFLKQRMDKSGVPVQYIVENVSVSDSIKMILLPDHSKVWLNNGSTLQYVDAFSGNERKVILSGEAYFEVQPDPSKPFRVETDAFTVKVLGTSFNVSTYAGDGIVEAALIKGSVVIEDEDQRELLLLSPGQKVQSTKGSQILRVLTANTDLVTSWKRGFISFENATIEEIVAKLEAIYGKPIEIAPSVLNNLTYTGAVVKEDSIDNLLKSLQNTIPFEYTTAGSRIVISIHNNK